VLKPGSVKVTAYTPGRKSMMRYCPSPSLVVTRTFSIRTGLVASTVTPGSTPPVASLTTPAIALWAQAGGADMPRTSAAAAMIFFASMPLPLLVESVKSGF
jgi:hypothetical protein